MAKRQQAFTVILALIAGLVGGVVSSHFLGSASAQKTKDWKVIEANEFRVVSSTGNLLATFGSEESPFIPKGKTVPVDEPLISGPRLVMYSPGEDMKKSVMLSADGISTKSISAPFAQFMTVDVRRLQEDLSVPIEQLAVLPSGSLTISQTKGRDAVLEIHDKESNVRAVLGTAKLKNKDTGSTEVRAPSSLVLFDEEGKVLFSAP